MPVASVKEEEIAVAMVDEVKPRDKVANKTAAKKTVVKKKKKKRENNELCEPKKKAKVKTEEGDSTVATGEAQVWTCKKNDGKRWSCHRPVTHPNSLCVHHSDHKRACNNLFTESISTAAQPPAASKLSTSSKRRRKKSLDVGQGFYYYAGFGPSFSKRHHRSSSVQESPPAEQNEAPEDHAAPAADQAQADGSSDHPAAARDDMARIAGGDEESSDDDVHGCNGNGEPRVVGINGDSKRTSPLKKRWRKPVKARSLKSLM